MKARTQKKRFTWRRCYHALESIHHQLKTLTVMVIASAPEPAYAVNDAKRIQMIKKFICGQFRISEAQLVSKCRTEELIWPRHLAIYLCRQYTTSSSIKIGEAFKRDHSSVLFSIEAVKDRMATSKVQFAQVVSLNGHIGKLFAKQKA